MDNAKLEPKEVSLFRNAVRTGNLRKISSLLKKKIHVDTSLSTTGPTAGYTALHFACLYRNHSMIDLLIKDHKANVNAVGDDGAQPLHLACIHDGDPFVILDLLDAKADVNTECRREIFLKYTRFGEWPDDFGDKITLLTFLVTNQESSMALTFLNHNADPKVNKSLNNKTLLMCAIENYDYNLAGKIAFKLKDHPEALNARDNDGLHAFHYIFHKNNYGDFRYDEKQFDMRKRGTYNFVSNFVEYGADIYATVNGDPDTLIINIAAYRGCFETIRELLPRYGSNAESKVLHYVTLPVADPQKYLRLQEQRYRNSPNIIEEIEQLKKVTTEFIIKHYVIRRAFGLSVPAEEVRLMDEIVATNSNIRDSVQNYEKKFIHGILKETIIQYGNESATLYEIITKICNDRLLRPMVRDKELIEAIKNSLRNLKHEDDINVYSHYGSTQSGYFTNMIVPRIEMAERRSKLRENLRKISQLRKFIPLPYEVILCVVDYLSNDDMKKFISAFYL